jgi:hypothetical protein
MSFARAVLTWRITALALAAIYAIAAILGLLADFDRGATIVWVALLGGGALLIVLGNRIFNSSPALAGILASVGGAAGAFPLFWLILVPLAAAALIALSVAIARQSPSAT